LRRLVALNIFDAFVTGAYMLIIPLLLVERSVNLATIGAVFSAFPIVFMVSRILFASAADTIGLKKFFNLNALCNLVSVALYAVSTSPLSYAAAKAIQGVKESSLWAVNRNAVYEITTSENPQMVTVTVIFLRALALAAGAVVSGFLILYVDFRGAFALLAVVSTLIFIPARMLDVGRERHRLTLNELLGKLDPASVDRRIWLTSLVMSIYVAGSTLSVGFVLPILLRSRGLGYWETGITLAMYNGAGALLLPATLRRTPSAKNTIMLQLFLYLPAVALIPVAGSWFVMVMVIMMALGESTNYITWESLVNQTVKGSENMATAIGFLHTPSKLVMIPSFLTCGVIK